MNCKNCNCNLGRHNIARIVIGNDTYSFCSEICLNLFFNTWDEVAEQLLIEKHDLWSQLARYE
jgi:hypothetical protein